MVKQPQDAPTSRREPTAAEVRAELERILRSRCFEHAGRASDFLRFVVGETLAGEGDRLKGYTIAISVFGRPADFDAQADPLVRVEALRLRQRLTEYYAGEGAADPVRIELPRGAYAIRAAYVEREETAAGAPEPGRVALGVRQGPWLAGSLAAALLLAVTCGWLVLREPAPAAEPDTLLAPHRTKIAVVPLENLSGNPAFDGLAAGLTEEIMLRLDQLDLFVIATQAQWYRPGKALDGVMGAEHSYVMTGSVRDHGGGARVALKIIEAKTGALIWSAAYDEPPGIEWQPELQARLARNAAAAAGLFGPVFDAELALARSSTHELELPDCQTRYRAFRRATDPALFPEAFSCFESLVARQPKLAHAWAGLAMLYIDDYVYYSDDADDESTFARARTAVTTALELDRSNVLANIALTRFNFYAGDPAFMSSVSRTLELDPDNAELLGLLGILLTAYGDATHGLELTARAHALSPQPRGAFNLAYAFANLQEGAACAALAKALALDADKWFIAHMITAAAAGSCGNRPAADQARARLLALVPQFEADAVALIDRWRFDPRLRAAVLEGLEAAGFVLDGRQ